MSSSRITRGLVKGLAVVGIGVIGWAYFTPSEEEMRKRLKGSPTHAQTDMQRGERLYREAQNKQLFDVIKKGAGITDEDLAKRNK